MQSTRAELYEESDTKLNHRLTHQMRLDDEAFVREVTPIFYSGELFAKFERWVDGIMERRAARIQARREGSR